VAYAAETLTPGVYGWYIDLDMVRAEETISGATNNDISGQAPPDVQYPGEKAIRRFIFRDGVILTTTVLPATNATSCFGSRPGAILILDALTGGDPGEAVIDFNLDGVVDDADLLTVGGQDFTAGLVFDFTQLDGQLVDLSTLGGQGDTDFLFICGGNECISRRIRDLNDNKTGRLSWTELRAN
jgi:Tfp pilus tip-associated adhesin PilY1